MANQKNHEIRLKSRPVGLPTSDNFEVAETAVPTPGPGQVLVRNSYISVDPYMRGRMIDRKSYSPPFKLGEALQGHAVGQVVASNSDAAKVGDFVQSMQGWREWYVAGGAEVQKFEPAVPIQSYLGALGMPGMTAYAGLLRVGALKDGERVFVSAASGAVGSIVCQIAKAKGCYVVGSVGSDEKAAYLKSLGVDKTINYKTCGNLNAAVAAAFPEGIDVYFENVGGTHLEAALYAMRPFGRIPFCGMIDMYNAVEPPPGPNNLAMIIGLQLDLKGFIVSSHYDMLADFHRDMAAWAKAGKMKWRETVVDGVENAPAAFIGLFKGDNVGKMVVRVGPDKAV
ncbi:MAG TPA: NADP-dependent oxidoreductase [Rhizomicrobium sp.]|jgi:NADPH-dependent curcumin reductase CurA|nr:NADP-dependent oxidoreductase [Rhizomicrobium sp.]